MNGLKINELGVVNYEKFSITKQLEHMKAEDKFDIFAFKSCGGSCGDSNCS